MRALATALLCCLALASGCTRTADPQASAAALPLTGLLAEGTAGDYAEVTAPRAFVFPRDWGSHPRYRSEWWYYTGNVTGGDGARYGFELTFFRFALTPAGEQRASDWGARQVWMAHLALTDAGAGRLLAEERLERQALGLAGAEAAPFKVWVGDWSATKAAADSAPFELEAHGDEIGLSLSLAPRTPVIAEGEHGMDRKGAEAGNASYYYSLPRLAVEGQLSIGGEEHRVRGEAWMDREWGSSALPAGTVGWDWFGLQLADGRELMYYRLRHRDGSASPFSGGALIGPDGETTRLGPEDVRLEPAREWRSEASGARYPVAWRLAIPVAALELEIAPLVDAQELDLSVRYWEGAVSVSGSDSGQPISGAGYLELTGY